MIIVRWKSTFTDLRTNILVRIFAEFHSLQSDTNQKKKKKKKKNIQLIMLQSIAMRGIVQWFFSQNSLLDQLVDHL